MHAHPPGPESGGTDTDAGLGTTAAVAGDPTATAAPPGTGDRLRSVDVARGLVVGLSAVLSHIPDPAYTFARHAEWYGLRLLDLILPGFLTLFGTGIALAYRRGVRWRRLARRTALLIGIGLLFNAVVAWSVDPSTWRFTGVLQLFAVVGLVVTLVTRGVRTWWHALLVAVVLLLGLQVLHLVVGAGCADSLPQPGCAPSTVIDPAIFGEAHLYRQFTEGYDPEGVPVMAGATATVLIGYVAGELLWRTRGRGATARLTALGVVLLAAVPLAAADIPVSKRLWTPAFALLSAAVPVLLLAVLHLVVDRLPGLLPAGAPLLPRVTWLPEAFGRNSLLVYFGKYLVAAVLAHVSLGGATGGEPVAAWLYGRLGEGTDRPALAYAALMFTGWAVVAGVLHRRGRYVRV